MRRRNNARLRTERIPSSRSALIGRFTSISASGGDSPSRNAKSPSSHSNREVAICLTWRCRASMSPRGESPPAARRARPTFSPPAARRMASSHCSRVIRPHLTRCSDSRSEARVDVACTTLPARRYNPIAAPSQVKDRRPARPRTRRNSRMSAQLSAFSLPRISATPSTLSRNQDPDRLFAGIRGGTIGR